MACTKQQGKRSPDWELGVLYEGVFNRWIVNEIAKNLEYEKNSLLYFSTRK